MGPPHSDFASIPGRAVGSLHTLKSHLPSHAHPRLFCFLYNSPVVLDQWHDS